MKGRIEVITGGMFSGKSFELIRRVRRLGFSLAVRGFKVFNHIKDKRYGVSMICTHFGDQLACIACEDSKDIDHHAIESAIDVVAIDEAQFFDMGLVDVCEALANEGKRVIVAGLDLDSDGKPFGPMPYLMAIAERVDKLAAVCMLCGEDASRSFHKPGKSEVVDVGWQQYEARCRECSLPSKGDNPRWPAQG